MKRKPNWKVAVAITVCLALLVGCGIAANGEPGVGIDNIVNNGDGTFTIFLTDETYYTSDNFTGPQGPQGPEGPAGPGLENIKYSLPSGSGTTSNTTYTDLTGGPSVTFSTSGGAVLVILTAYIKAAANYQAYMGFQISGSSSYGPFDFRALMQENGSSVGAMQASAVYYVSLNSGSYTFTAKYRVTGGTGTFSKRSIIVIPIELS